MLLPQCWICNMHSLEAHSFMQFFFLKTVYLVNSEEPKSQNCCSRNHFEGDNFKRFSTEPTVPKPYTLNSAGQQHLPQPTPSLSPYGSKPPAALGALAQDRGAAKARCAGGRLLQIKTDQEGNRLLAHFLNTSALCQQRTLLNQLREWAAAAGLKARAGELPHASMSEGPGQTSVPKHTPPLGTPG